MNGTLRVVKGDATTPQIDAGYEEQISVIPHVCNDGGGWGAGFVLALSKKWSKPEAMYRSFIESSGKMPTLGKTCFAKIDNYLVVANMIAQKNYKSDENPIPLKYKALANCMADVAEYVSMVQDKLARVSDYRRVVIHCCQFGSDLAGGDWNFILELIREIWLENGIDVVVYEFEADESKWGPIEE